MNQGCGFPRAREDHELLQVHWPLIFYLQLRVAKDLIYALENAGCIIVKGWRLVSH